MGGKLCAKQRDLGVDSLVTINLSFIPFSPEFQFFCDGLIPFRIICFNPMGEFDKKSQKKRK
ncbi:MAG: hypothetical protein KKE50_07450, partial [Nanoarchaeota archaeon]|nr:hypothetical protein [Nanoarchaeota archaeon]